MGTMEIFLCIFLAHFVTVQAVIKRHHHAPFFHDVPGFFDMSFPFQNNFDFTPYDTMFSSWQSPAFDMLAELPPIMIIPRVEVFCDESKLTLVVDKRANDVVLTAEELQLGDGCYSNKELPNQFVFTYSLDQCGTTHVMQNGLLRLTNTLHLNLKKPSNSWWHTPPTVHISCTPLRSYPNFFDSMVFPKNVNTFHIKAMNPSWTSTAQTNIYERGQVVNFQVSAKSRPEQQLFIQSCFVSASPEPQAKPKHAVVMNKGCTAPLGSSHAVVQFVVSDRADVVNFALNTTYLISELYVHCSVLLSDQGVTFGSKSCNYNLIQSRWEDLSGNVQVCECCSSKCRGLLKQVPEDAKALVTAGPFVIVDKHDMRPQPSVSEPQEASSTPAADSVQSDPPAAEETIVSGASVSRNPQGVVVVRQEAPVAKLTVWLPGQVQNIEHHQNIGSKSEVLRHKLPASDTETNELPELQPLTRDALLNIPTNAIRGQSSNELTDSQMWDLSLLTLVDGWAVPPPVEKAAFAEESQRKRRFGRSDAEAPQTADVTVQTDFNQMEDELADAAAMSQGEANDAQPIIRTKLEFSKSTDGSQTLSYEEEVVRKKEGRSGSRKSRQSGLRSTFLDLLRRMDGAE